jgi:hypothetical protein
MKKITKKSIAFLIAKCLKYYYCFLRHTFVSQFHGKKFSFYDSELYQNFRCRVKRTGPKSPTLPYMIQLKKKTL